MLADPWGRARKVGKKKRYRQEHKLVLGLLCNTDLSVGCTAVGASAETPLNSTNLLKTDDKSVACKQSVILPKRTVHEVSLTEVIQIVTSGSRQVRRWEGLNNPRESGSEGAVGVDREGG